MRPIPLDALTLRPFHILDKRWALLVGGTKDPNPMTVSWGGFGTVWHRPAVTVYVRPTRHTFSLLQAESFFTLNVLPDKLRPALELCGTRSGRDLDKWAAAGLTPLASETVPVPRVAEAVLSFECRVMATLQVDPGRFLDPAVHENYPEKDYHTAYLGEVLHLWGTKAFAGE